MASSKLQIEVGDLLDKTLPEYRIRENYRPDWLMSSNFTKLELDFYIEELKIAIEVQGLQHYEFIPFFYKTMNDFEKRKLYDQQKKDLCYGAGVRLIEIDCLMDAIVIIKEIADKLEPDNKIPYAIPDTEQDYVKTLKDRADNRISQMRYELTRVRVENKRLVKECELWKGVAILKTNTTRVIETSQPVVYYQDPHKQIEIWQRKSIKAFNAGLNANCEFSCTCFNESDIEYIKDELEKCQSVERIKSLFLYSYSLSVIE